MLREIKQDIEKALIELLEIANLKERDLFVVGCSSSEVAGHKIGSASSIEIGEAIFSAIHPILKERGIYLAAQCCEHLNRALILEEAQLFSIVIEVIVPQPSAGGSFATQYI